MKTTLRPGDVKTFLSKLDHFKQWLPRYANHRIYGAMAWLSADAGTEAMLANREGVALTRLAQMADSD